jgi:hypothetical protein
MHSRGSSPRIVVSEELNERIAHHGMRAIPDHPGSCRAHIPIAIGQVREQAFSGAHIIDITQGIHNFVAQDCVGGVIELEQGGQCRRPTRPERLGRWKPLLGRILELPQQVSNLGLGIMQFRVDHGDSFLVQSLVTNCTSPSIARQGANCPPHTTAGNAGFGRPSAPHLHATEEGLGAVLSWSGSWLAAGCA